MLKIMRIFAKIFTCFAIFMLSPVVVALQNRPDQIIVRNKLHPVYHLMRLNLVLFGCKQCKTSSSICDSQDIGNFKLLLASDRLLDSSIQTSVVERGIEAWKELSDTINFRIDSLNVSNFDNDGIRWSLGDSIDDALDNLIPAEFEDISGLREDIGLLLNRMAYYLSDVKAKGLICRLALMNGVRCPKWHEDYVTLRLIKTYVGEGTHWVNPGNYRVRLVNFIRKSLDMDLSVGDSDILQLSPGEALVMSGRGRSGSGHVPVLHRSPIVDETDRRLILTITVP